MTNNQDNLYRYSHEIFDRSCVLYDILFKSFSNRKNSSFKSIGLFSKNKTIFSKNNLRKNCVLFGCCMQFRLISHKCDCASDLIYYAIAYYVNETYPDESIKAKELILHDLSIEFSVFDFIDSGSRPTHVGLPMLPQDGSFTDNLFYRYSVWMIENSLEVPSPLFDANFVFEVCHLLTSWFEVTQKAVSLHDFSDFS